MQLGLPLGFRFDPTDEELVKHYLVRKVVGQELPWNNGIGYCELYGNKAPWEIFSEAEDEEKIYVFTKLKKASHIRIVRVAGCGTWHFDKVKEEIYDAQKKIVIGFKKTFSFKVKGLSTETKIGHWIMHEFSLASADNCLKRKNVNCDYVICRIYKKSSNSKCLNEKEIIIDVAQTQWSENFWVGSESIQEISGVTMLEPRSILPTLELCDIGNWSPVFEDYFSDDNNYHVQQVPEKESEVLTIDTRPALSYSSCDSTDDNLGLSMHGECSMNNPNPNIKENDEVLRLESEAALSRTNSINAGDEEDIGLSMIDEYSKNESEVMMMIESEPTMLHDPFEPNFGDLDLSMFEEFLMDDHEQPPIQ